MLGIGIDIGTTTICAVVLDSGSGRVAESITVENDTFISGKSFERLQDPDAIIQKCMEILHHLTGKYNVGCIGITGQMHGIVYLDSSGNAVSPLYTWQDMRGMQTHPDGKTYAGLLSELTGCKVASGFGSVTNFYNMDKDLIDKNAKVFCTIHDYLAMKLTGKTRPAVHPSNGASFGCYDLTANKFKALEKDFFPEIECNKKILGETGAGIAVSIAIGDNQASFMGSVKDPDSSLLINIGTGSQVSVVSSQIYETENIETRPYDNGLFLNVGASLCGGRAYALLKDFFDSIIYEATGTHCDNLYQIMDAISEKAYNSGETVTVDTRFGGTRSNAGIKGSITGIGTENFIPSAFSAGVQQGIAEELYSMYREMELIAKPLRLVGSGNALRKNKLLQKICAKKFRLPLYIPEFNEEAAFGAALFAMTGAGEFKSLSGAQSMIGLSVNPDTTL